MPWLGHLQLHYARDGERTVAHDRHEGPLRVLQRLYPEGPGICHHVLVHPPGGIVGGDELRVDLHLAPQCHAMVTTPGAARFYRSTGDTAVQRVDAKLDDGARLEWLPLETIAYSGCQGRNLLDFSLAPGAQMVGWDVLALGLPAADQPFERGRFEQRLALGSHWLERGVIDADDGLLLDSPLGLAGHRVTATLWFASGDAIAPALAEELLDAARGSIDEHAPSPSIAAGVTQLDARTVVVRALADRVEPVSRMLKAVRGRWRMAAWQLHAHAPRIWQT